MCTGALCDKYKSVTLNLINKKPVGFDMTFTKAGVISGKRVVTMRRLKRTAIQPLFFISL